MNLDDYLTIVGDYADRLARAEQDADRDSMIVADAIDTQYEGREWVAEWLEQSPRPKNGGSNAWKEDSRNRFAQWQTWKLQQAGRRSISGTHTYRLINARRLTRALNFTTGEIRSEIAIRPLTWLLRNRYEDRIPEIRPVLMEQIGDDLGNLTPAATRDALNVWKQATFGSRKDGTPRKGSGTTKAANAAGKANRIRVRILEEFIELYQLASINEKAQDEFRGLLADLDTFLDEHQATAA